MTQNPHLNPVTRESMARFWKAPFLNLYVPITYTFFAAEAGIARSLTGAGSIEFPDPS